MFLPQGQGWHCGTHRVPQGVSSEGNRETPLPECNRKFLFQSSWTDSQNHNSRGSWSFSDITGVFLRLLIEQDLIWKCFNFIVFRLEIQMENNYWLNFYNIEGIVVTIFLTFTLKLCPINKCFYRPVPTLLSSSSTSAVTDSWVDLVTWTCVCWPPSLPPLQVLILLHSSCLLLFMVGQLKAPDGEALGIK